MRKPPNASAYVVASIAFSFLPPRIARFFAVAILIGFAGLAGFLVQGEGVVFGIVETVRPPGDSLPDQLAEVRGLAIHDPAVATLRLSADVAAVADLAPGDLVFATGAPQRIGSFPLLNVTSALALPLSEALDRVDAALRWLDLPGLHPIGVILGAALLAIFAKVALRLVAAVTLAPMMALLALAAMTYNLAPRILPLPGDLVEPITVIGAIIGAVIGYKSLLRDPTGLAQRLAGAVLGLALAPLLAHALGAGPTHVVTFAIVMTLLGLLVPVTTPVLAAALLVHAWVPLDPVWAGLGVAGAVLAHLVIDQWNARRSGRAPGMPFRREVPAFQPAPDARGEFPLNQIITPKEG